jgi:hypothetical protein
LIRVYIDTTDSKAISCAYIFFPKNKESRLISLKGTADFGDIGADE